MKNRICIMLALVIAGCAQGETKPLPNPEWNATVRVVDENGQPVEGAEVTIGYYVPPPEGQTIALASKRGKTDASGSFRASEHSRTTDLFFGAGKDGYYRAHLEYELGHPLNYSPEQRTPTVTLVLRKIGRPIPMYAKSVNLGMPVFDEPAGFDLMAGDWVAPFGKGVSADILFTAHREKRSEQDSDYSLSVTFPNPGDGIQESSVPDTAKRSGLRLPHEAPAHGYQPKWVQTTKRRPGKAVETNRHEERNYFFRVRSVSDEKGNLKSALYGKIYGDFLKFRYYLNPEPNSRNLEFDPKQNLLKNLKPTERVEEP